VPRFKNFCKRATLLSAESPISTLWLHLTARGVITDPGSMLGCITTGRDWESHRAAHNLPSVVQGRQSL
jgi:hypothetical protein